MNEIYKDFDLQIETIANASAVTVRESILNRRHFWSYNWNPFANLSDSTLYGLGSLFFFTHQDKNNE